MADYFNYNYPAHFNSVKQRHKGAK